jgi:hypothetical protein
MFRRIISITTLDYTDIPYKFGGLIELLIVMIMSAIIAMLS